jgi:hypothetical protein
MDGALCGWDPGPFPFGDVCARGFTTSACFFGPTSFSWKVGMRTENRFPSFEPALPIGRPHIFLQARSSPNYARNVSSDEDGSGRFRPWRASVAVRSSSFVYRDAGQPWLVGYSAAAPIMRSIFPSSWRRQLMSQTRQGSCAVVPFETTCDEYAIAVFSSVFPEGGRTWIPSYGSITIPM